MKRFGLQMGPLLLLWARVICLPLMDVSNVLYVVPTLSYNLLSISKITRDLNCHVVFSLDNVFFQDLSSGRMIDTAQHNRGLHLLDDDALSRNCYRTSLLSSYFSSSKEDHMLWHFRLGHPNF